MAIYFVLTAENLVDMLAQERLNSVSTNHFPNSKGWIPYCQHVKAFNWNIMKMGAENSMRLSHERLILVRVPCWF